MIVASGNNGRDDRISAPACASKAISVGAVDDNDNHASSIKGLSWLNQGSKNGLLVILSENNKDLTPESRQLMSKMLKGIHFLPSETGFAMISDNAILEAKSCSLEGIKAILVFGNDTGQSSSEFE